MPPVTMPLQMLFLFPHALPPQHTWKTPIHPSKPCWNIIFWKKSSYLSPTLTPNGINPFPLRPL